MTSIIPTAQKFYIENRTNPNKLQGGVWCSLMMKRSSMVCNSELTQLFIGIFANKSHQSVVTVIVLRTEVNSFRESWAEAERWKQNTHLNGRGGINSVWEQFTWNKARSCGVNSVKSDLAWYGRCSCDAAPQNMLVSLTRRTVPQSTHLEVRKRNEWFPQSSVWPAEEACC